MAEELVDQIRVPTLHDRCQKIFITVPNQLQKFSYLPYDSEVCRGQLAQLVDRCWEVLEKLSVHGLDGEVLFKKPLHDPKAIINTLGRITRQNIVSILRVR